MCANLIYIETNKIMKRFIVILCAVCMASGAFAKIKVNMGSFNILKGERYVGTTLDFSKAKFDDRSLDEQLFAMNISQAEWKAFEKSCCVAINMAYAYKEYKGLTLGLKDVKKTKYYLVIQPLEIDLNDGECEVLITIKNANTGETLVQAQGDSKAKDTDIMKSFMKNFEDRSFWEFNILRDMAIIGMNVLPELFDF